MTDRINLLSVVLSKDIRDDDCEAIINAIKMVKGVLSVTPHVVDHADHIAQQRVRHELGEKLWAVLYPPIKV